MQVDKLTSRSQVVATDDGAVTVADNNYHYNIMLKHGPLQRETKAKSKQYIVCGD
jgi:hypothetical protein